MTQLNKQAYEKLIKENIDELEKFMPENSLEKQHTIEVLNWSIKAIYEPTPEKRGVCINCRHWRSFQNGRGGCSAFEVHTQEDFYCKHWSKTTT